MCCQLPVELGKIVVSFWAVLEGQATYHIECISSMNRVNVFSFTVIAIN